MTGAESLVIHAGSALQLDRVQWSWLLPLAVVIVLAWLLVRFVVSGATAGSSSGRGPPAAASSRIDPNRVPRLLRWTGLDLALSDVCDVYKTTTHTAPPWGRITGFICWWINDHGVVTTPKGQHHTETVQETGYGSHADPPPRGRSP